MKKGWIVAFAGMGFNLAIGVCYAWSVFSKEFQKAVADGGMGWTNTDASLPFMINIVIWAIFMIPAGRLQDKIGPRWVATAGGLCLGLGMFVTSFSTADNMWPAIIGFGGFCGTGMGLGYASATPAAIKWFPSTMKGRVTGVVVAGMGLASAYIAPTAAMLIKSYGVNQAFIILSIVFTLASVCFAQLLRNPPPGYHIPQIPAKAGQAPKPAAAPVLDRGWIYIMKTPLFYLLWFQFILGTSPGLMIIGNLARIAELQSMGAIVNTGFLFVAILSIANATGRMTSGAVSDKLGPNRTLMLVCAIQLVVLLCFSKFSTFSQFVAGAALMGFTYGSCMPLFPTMTAGLWGTKNLGLNYGVLYTAWGAAGVLGPIVASKIFDASKSAGGTGSYDAAYLAAASMLAITIGLGIVRELFGQKLMAPLSARAAAENAAETEPTKA